MIVFYSVKPQSLNTISYFFTFSCRIKSLYTLMGRELEDINEAVAGNIIGKL